MDTNRVEVTRSETDAARFGWRTAGLLCLIVLAFLLAGLDGLRRQESLSPYDTDRYLTDARWVHDHGGPLALPILCYQGRYVHDYNMPLYVGLLSALPCDSPRIFVWARLLTLALGAMGVLVTFYVARRLFGDSVALLSAALLALNGAYLFYSGVVGCEVLFVAFVVLAWFAIVRYVQGRGHFAWVGLWVALAYLTKGNGIFIAPAALGAVLYRERARALRSGQVWMGLVVFLAVASPILTRNVVRYGSPFHNLNSRVLWVDSWNEILSPANEATPPSLSRYLQSHSAGQIASRVGKGAVQEGVFLVVGAGGNHVLHDQVGLKVWPVGLALLGLALWGALERRAASAAVPAAGIAAVFILFFTWFPVKDLRFDLPIVPIILVFSAQGFLRGVQRLMRNRRSETGLDASAAASRLAAAIAALGVAAGAATLCASRTPARVCSYPPGYEQLARWIQAEAAGGAVLMMGPSHAYTFPWIAIPDGRQRVVPFVGTMSELQTTIAAHGVSCLVLDYSTLEQRRSAFDGWMKPEGKTVRVKRLPQRWQPVLTPAEQPPPYIAFRITRPQ